VSGADWRQQQELEEEQWEHEHLSLSEFIDGQKIRAEGRPIPAECSFSVVRGWIAQDSIEEIKRDIINAR